MSKLIGYDEHFKPIYRKDIIEHREFIATKKRCVEIYINRAVKACDKGDISIATDYRDMALIASGLIEQAVSKIRDMEEIQAQWGN